MVVHSAIAKKTNGPEITRGLMDITDRIAVGMFWGESGSMASQCREFLYVIGYYGLGTKESSKKTDDFRRQ